VFIGEDAESFIHQASAHSGEVDPLGSMPGVVHNDGTGDSMQVILHLHGTSQMYIWYSGL